MAYVAREEAKNGGGERGGGGGGDHASFVAALHEAYPGTLEQRRQGWRPTEQERYFINKNENSRKNTETN